jgi:hypothetical protein
MIGEDKLSESQVMRGTADLPGACSVQAMRSWRPVRAGLVRPVGNTGSITTINKKIRDLSQPGHTASDKIFTQPQRTITDRPNSASVSSAARGCNAVTPDDYNLSIALDFSRHSNASFCPCCALTALARFVFVDMPKLRVQIGPDRFRMEDAFVNDTTRVRRPFFHSPSLRLTHSFTSRLRSTARSLLDVY